MGTEILISDLIVLAKKHLLYLIKNIWIILIVSVIGGTIAIGLYFFVEKNYKSEITLINENDSQNKLGSYSSLADLVGIDLEASTTNSFKGDNILDLLRSQRMIETVLRSNYQENTTFIETYLNNHSIKFNRDALFSNSNIHLRYQDSLYTLVATRIIKKQISTRRIDKKTDLLKVEFVDKDENFSYRFLNKLLLNTQDFYIDYKTKKSQENVTILQAQLDSVKQLLFGNIDAVAKNQDATINLNKNKARTPAQQQQAEQQANAALYVELIKNLEMSKITLLKEKPFIQIIDASKLPLQSNKVSWVLIFLLGFILGLFFSSVVFVYKNSQA